MVDVIRDARILPAAQVRFKQAYSNLMGEASAQIAGVLLRHEDSDGFIPVSRGAEVREAAREIVRGVFVARRGDGYVSIEDDGTPVSPYARALMGEIAAVTVQTVDLHTGYMNEHLDDATRVMLTVGRSRRISEQGPGRLFDPNPLAVYEPAHTWVDPNGYVLSQRIWRNSLRTRDNLDGLLADLISQGKSSQTIARRVEQYLLPGRRQIRTNRPYGLYGVDASFDAMRLARTEISHAHNQAAWVSAYLNPYVDQVRVIRSGNGQVDCPICLEHGGPVGGEGIVYPVDAGFYPPFHPQCMCYVISEVTRSPQEVTAELRDMLVRAEQEQLLPTLTPVQRDAFIEMLLGNAVHQMLQQLLPIQLALGL